jgi:hypothetical protein
MRQPPGLGNVQVGTWASGTVPSKWHYLAGNAHARPADMGCGWWLVLLAQAEYYEVELKKLKPSTAYVVKVRKYMVTGTVQRDRSHECFVHGTPYQHTLEQARWWRWRLPRSQSAYLEPACMACSLHDCQHAVCSTTRSAQMVGEQGERGLLYAPTECSP